MLLLNTRHFFSFCFILAGLLVAPQRSFTASCNQDCAAHVECEQENCPECREVVLGVYRCRSCCDNNYAACVVPGSPCFWNGDQCQNIEGVDCNEIDEVPEGFKSLILGVVLLGSFSLLSLVFWKKNKTKSRHT